MGQCKSCFSDSQSGVLGYKNINLKKQFSIGKHHANGNITNGVYINNDTNVNNGNHLTAQIPKLQLTSPGQTNFSLDMNHLEESELLLESKYSDLVIPPTTTLSNFLINEFKKIGDKTAMVDVLLEKTYSYPNLLSLSRNICSAILTYELKQGDGVAFLLPNCCELVCLFIGVVGAGGTALFIDPSQKDEDIEYQLAQVSPKFLFIDRKEETKLRPITEKISSIQQIFCLFGESDFCLAFDKFLSESDRNIIARTKLSVEPKTDIAAIFFTRGRVTGTQKGVMLSHYNILSNLYQIRVMYDIHSNDQILNMYPMYTAYGFIIASLYSLIQGSATFLLHTQALQSPETFVKTIETNKISHIYLTPETALFMSECPAMAKCNMERVKEIIFGADQPAPQLVESLRSKFRMLKDIRFSFAMTEFSPLSHVTPPKTTRVGSFGVLLPNTMCKVIGVDSKELLGPMRKGQMCIKGPQVFVGYVNNEAETAKVLAPDGWFYTDDVVYYDKEMHFFYVSPLENYLKLKQHQEEAKVNNNNTSATIPTYQTEI